MANGHVNFVSIGESEVSDDCRNVFDIVGKTIVSALTTAFVVSSAMFVFDDPRKPENTDHAPKVESKRIKWQL